MYHLQYVDVHQGYRVLTHSHLAVVVKTVKRDPILVGR